MKLFLTCVFLTACSGAPFSVMETSGALASPPEAAAPLPVEASAPDTSEASVSESAPAEASTPPPVVEADAGVDSGAETSAADASSCASFAFVPPSVDFGALMVGASEQKTVYLVNRGSCATAPVLTGWGSPPTYFTAGSECAGIYGTVLSPGGPGCPVTVTFSPVGPGYVSAAIGGLVNGQAVYFIASGTGQ